LVHLGWADLTGNWPNLPAGVSSPLRRYSGDFVTAAGFDGVAGVNVTISATASGYTPNSNPTGIDVSCTGTQLEIQTRTFLTGENVTCQADTSITFGPSVEQQTASTVHLISGTGISFNGPLSIATGAILTTNPAGSQP